MKDNKNQEDQKGDQLLRGLVLVFLLLVPLQICSTFYFLGISAAYVCIILLFLPLLLVPNSIFNKKRLWRNIIHVARVVLSLIEWAFICWASGLLEFYTGTKINIIKGRQTVGYVKANRNQLNSSEKTVSPILSNKADTILITSNHRTRVDWMYHWCLASRLNFADSYRVILKESLQNIPWLGWSMQCMIFIFLKRGRSNRGTDLNNICSKIDYLTNTISIRNSLIIFPEGTDLSPENIVKNNKFADENNLKRTKYTLHPRTLGVAMAFQTLQDNIDRIYDLTMAYMDYNKDERPNEILLFKGRWPKEVNIQVDTIDIVSPKVHVNNNNNKDRVNENNSHYTEFDMTSFVQKSFEEKETFLQNFYENQDVQTSIGDTTKDFSEKLRGKAFNNFCIAGFFYLCLALIELYFVTQVKYCGWALLAIFSLQTLITATVPGGISGPELHFLRDSCKEKPY